jgi:RNA polymerase sigma factor (sigma-70 family)
VADDESISDLVLAAAGGSAHAWDSIVERFSPLLWSICRRHRLSRQDADDVCQDVWVRLAESLNALRDPAALPGWLATTTRRECLRMIGKQRGEVLSDMAIDRSDDVERTDPARPLLQAERHDALLIALGELPDKARQLLMLLIEDPPRSYKEISDLLGIPIGSIGPTRARHLQRLRESPALAGLVPTRTEGAHS